MSWNAPTYEDVFYRIETKIWRVDEEIRYDIPVSLVNATTYIGVSGIGTSTGANQWAIVRTDYNSDQIPTRKQCLYNQSWSGRTLAPWQ